VTAKEDSNRQALRTALLTMGLLVDPAEQCRDQYSRGYITVNIGLAAGRCFQDLHSVGVRGSGR
jgi:hypothetical protein